MSKKRKFAIGDVHGCYKTLEKLLFKEIRIKKKDKLIFLGDYIDRGPDSKSVLDLLLKLKEKKYNVVYLKGNHDQMMIDYIKNKGISNWFSNGGLSTIDSFKNSKKIKGKYIELLEGLEYYHITKKFLYVHGGLNFDVEYPLKDKSSMIWIRNSSVDKKFMNGRQMVVGHTPKNLNTIIRSLEQDIIYLDGGCVYKTRNSGMGYLCALEMKSKELYYTYNIDM